jgi:S1-C subfamily serine protease
VGSGFVAAPNKVMTAARTVSGSGSVTVEAEGQTYDATVVSYDPTADVAILDVSQLPQPPLTFTNQAAPTDADAVVLGYPDAGEFKATPARIREMVQLNGPDIYRTIIASREMYAFRGIVRRTDLGGPLISTSGQVVGMVIGASSDDADTAYALSANQLVAPLSTIGNTQPVSTGDCA